MSEKVEKTVTIIEVNLITPSKRRIADLLKAIAEFVAESVNKKFAVTVKIELCKDKKGNVI